MKQTAVEFVFDAVYRDMPYPELLGILAEARIMEKQQMIEMHDKGFDSVEESNDEFAIGFAEWLLIIYNEDIIYDAYSKEELLEIYKKENNL